LHDPFDPAAVTLTDPALHLDAPVGAVAEPEALAAAAARAAATLPSGVRARDLRSWVIDTERGLVVDFALLDVANEEGPSPEAKAGAPASSTGPYSLMTTTLYQTAGDAATAAANATLVVPYGMKTAENQ
jgi:hypothetical protein